MTGRPSDFTQEIADEICSRLARGESLRSITGADRDDFMPSETTVRRWLSGENDWNEAFRRQYAQAREAQADYFVDEIIDIADGIHQPDAAELNAIVASDTTVIRDHNRDRLRIDARKWVAAKLAPKKYGEKLDLNHSGGVTLTHEQMLDSLR